MIVLYHLNNKSNFLTILFNKILNNNFSGLIYDEKRFIIYDDYLITLISFLKGKRHE